LTIPAASIALDRIASLVTSLAGKQATTTLLTQLLANLTACTASSQSLTGDLTLTGALNTGGNLNVTGTAGLLALSCGSLATLNGGLTVSGTITLPAASLTTAMVSGLDTALTGKQATSSNLTQLISNVSAATSSLTTMSSSIALDSGSGAGRTLTIKGYGTSGTTTTDRPQLFMTSNNSACPAEILFVGGGSQRWSLFMGGTPYNFVLWGTTDAAATNQVLNVNRNSGLLTCNYGITVVGTVTLPAASITTAMVSTLDTQLAAKQATITTSTALSVASVATTGASTASSYTASSIIISNTFSTSGTGTSYYVLGGDTKWKMQRTTGTDALDMICITAATPSTIMSLTPTGNCTMIGNCQMANLTTNSVNALSTSLTLKGGTGGTQITSSDSSNSVSFNDDKSCQYYGDVLMDAGSGSANRILTVKSRGNTDGTGLTSRAELRLEAAGNASGRVLFANNGLQRWEVFSDWNASSYNFFIWRADDSGARISTPALQLSRSTGAATFSSSVSATSYITTSDARLKSEISCLSSCLDLVQAVTPKRYKKHNAPEGPERDQYSEPHYENGFLAQEIPAELADTCIVESESGLLSVNYNSLIAVLWGAVRELQEEVRALTNDPQAPPPAPPGLSRAPRAKRSS
jgi:hypothetical protein